jgi:hypothetical protein
VSIRLWNIRFELIVFITTTDDLTYNRRGADALGVWITRIRRLYIQTTKALSRTRAIDDASTNFVQRYQYWSLMKYWDEVTRYMSGAIRPYIETHHSCTHSITTTTDLKLAVTRWYTNGSDISVCDHLHKEIVWDWWFSIHFVKLIGWDAVDNAVSFDNASGGQRDHKMLHVRPSHQEVLLVSPSQTIR